MPPVVVAFVTVAGAVLTARYLKKEWDRVNRELDAADLVRVKQPATLRRDPVTGIWHPK